MADSLSRPLLRRLLNERLSTDPLFNAFVGDYFPLTYREFNGAMDRTSRITLLLQSIDLLEIAGALFDAYPGVREELPPGLPFVKPVARAESKSDLKARDLSQETISTLDTRRGKYVLHLSDLHFGTLADAAQWHTQLILDLRNQLGIKELAAVILSGDITEHATSEQFAAAKRFIDLLANSSKLPAQRLAITPGNHDVSWPLAKLSYIKQPSSILRTENLTPGFYYNQEEKSSRMVWIRQDLAYLKRFEPFCSFYESVCGLTYPLAYGGQATLQHFPELNLLVLGLNSAWNTDHAFPRRAGLHQEAFGVALGEIVTKSEFEKAVKMAVWHHPPSELTKDGGLDGAVLQQLAQAGFRLLLHGHIHRTENPNFRYYRDSPIGGIEILSAGTFGAPTHALVPGYPFQYQVLEFTEDWLTVHTRKREDEFGGWVADQRWQQSPGQSPLSYYRVRLR